MNGVFHSTVSISDSLCDLGCVTYHKIKLECEEKWLLCFATSILKDFFAEKIKTYIARTATSSHLELELIKGTNPALKKPSNIPEIYAKMFGRFH